MLESTTVPSHAMRQTLVHMHDIKLWMIEYFVFCQEYQEYQVKSNKCQAST